MKRGSQRGAAISSELVWIYRLLSVPPFLYEISGSFMRLPGPERLAVAALSRRIIGRRRTARRILTGRPGAVRNQWGWGPLAKLSRTGAETKKPKHGDRINSSLKISSFKSTLRSPVAFVRKISSRHLFHYVFHFLQGRVLAFKSLKLISYSLRINKAAVFFPALINKILPSEKIHFLSAALMDPRPVSQRRTNVIELFYLLEMAGLINDAISGRV
jgi:hypothetical protein